ncbi:MAG: hypothetical protein LKE52_01705 [Bacilli bacterium]|jgi:membrane protein DedA with SNARE-associated domain|nr:hypothetical protein [Bacilli bacterium]
MTTRTHSRFPWKKTFATSALILISASLVLSLLYAILSATGNTKNPVTTTLVIVWGAIFGGLLVFLWISRIIGYIKRRKDEE